MELRNPIFGNRIILNQNSNAKRTLDGDLIINSSNFPIFDGFNVTIKALDSARRDELITYFKAIAGQQITLIDQDTKTWQGFITTDPELICEGNGCLYTLNFGFDGILIS